jgi:preprotein translocase subunit SecG
MSQIFSIIQIILAISIIILIITQGKGEGLGSVFGGSSEFYHSKRGLDKILFNLTIILVALFLLTSIIRMLIGSQ